MLPPWFFLTALGLFGLAFGSFANVVIWRFPRAESLSRPPSRCPACDSPIAWRDNIPLVSWFILRGRCRTCGGRISLRYPLVEALSGVLWVLAGARFGQTWQTAFAVAFFFLLMILSFIDWDVMRLPDPLVGLLAAIAAAGSVLSLVTRVPLVPLTSVFDVAGGPVVTSIIGALLGIGAALVIAAIYRAIRKVEGFGGGDVKLLGAMGLFLGPYVLLAFFGGSILGAGYGLIATAAKRLRLQAKFPFGPFLAIGGVLTALVGPSLWQWYAGLLA